MKKFNKIIFYTILVFCISAFSCFPESYSKYIKEEEPVRYYVGIEKLYIGDIGVDNLTILNTSTYKTANYKFSFNRSQVMKDGDNSQQVTIKIKKSSCKITKIITNGNYSKNGNTATITYTSKGTDNITVNYSCDVAGIINDNDKLETDIEIKEKFKSEVEYLYAEIDDPGMASVEYYKLYPRPIAQISDDAKTLTLPKDLDDKYAEFTKWINAYISKMNDIYGGDYSLEINTYINSVYNENNLLANNLKGLTVTDDSDNEAYVYQIDDNFLGYAMTYFARQISSDLTKVVFSNNGLSHDEANEILEYYFTEYSNYNEDQIEKIMLYVSNYGSINHMLIPKQDGTHKEIFGFTYLPDVNTDTDPDQIKINDNLMQYIDIFINKRIVIPFDEMFAMYELFEAALTLGKDEGFIGSDLYDVLVNNDDIFYSIIMNSTDLTNTPTAYTDYITIQDPSNGKYVLVKISSDGKTGTTVEIKELGVASSLSIVPVTDGYNVSMTLDNSNVDNAKLNTTSIMSGIDSYFGTSYVDEITDQLFVSSSSNGNITSTIEGDNVTISYTITQTLN